MTLMQLHQRILTTSDIEDIATGNPYAGVNKRTELHTRQTPHTIPEEPPMRSPHRQMVTRMANPDEYRPSSRQTHQLMTPDMSPSQEQDSFVLHSESQSLPIRRPKPPMLAPTAHTPSPTPPTPPFDLAISAPPGPPPTTPLPPAPVDWHRQKRREELAEIKSEAERRAQSHNRDGDSGRSFLDKTFAQVEETWQNPWEQELSSGKRHPFQGQRPTATTKYEFQEPHPGTPVDPSRVDEPRDYGSFSPTAVGPPVDLDEFPAPGTSPRRLHIQPRMMPPRFNPHDSAASSPPDKAYSHAGALARMDRTSMASNGTYSSYTSGSSAQSAISRGTSFSSSSASWIDQPPVPNLPNATYGSRSKSFARVPEPIYESAGPTASQSTLSTVRAPGLRRPSAPAAMHASASTATLESLPPVPPVPCSVPSSIDPRRASAFSQGSNSSSGSGMPPPVAVRVIPAHITNASDSKLYLPTEANKFGGLCKGAWRAQIGDFKKAYQPQQRPGGIATARMVDFMRCKTCEFSGKVSINDKGKKVPDRKVLIAKDTGLAYRWDFLFKSHLTMRAGSSADAEYGCMFCCAEGKGTPIFKGMNAFIGHVSEHRPNVAGNTNDYQVPGASVCDRMEVLVGRTMNLEERFEVALPVAEVQTSFAPLDGPLSPLSPGASDGRTVSRGSSRY